jgi:hypothetical protein
MKCNDIPYGFEYGAAKMTRCMSDEKKGWVVLMLETPKANIQIYVTKTGKVRVYDYNLNKEMRPMETCPIHDKQKGE